MCVCKSSVTFPVTYETEATTHATGFAVAQFLTLSSGAMSSAQSSRTRVILMGRDTVAVLAGAIDRERVSQRGQRAGWPRVEPEFLGE